MPFLLSIIGLILIVSAYQNTYSQLSKLVANDFTGSGNFLYWMIAVLVIGSVGYYSPKSQMISRLFLGLVLLGIIFSSKTAGILGSILPQLQSGTTQQASAPSASGSNADTFASSFLNAANGGTTNNNALTDFTFAAIGSS